jgi:integrase/recombinase XerD
MDSRRFRMNEQEARITSMEVEEWETVLQIKGKGDLTVAQYVRVAGKYLEFCDGDVCKRTVRAWLADMGDLGQSSRATYFAIVKQFTKWLAAEKLTQGDASEGVSVEAGKVPVFTPLTQQQVAAIIKAAAENSRTPLRDEAVIRMLASTGTRVSECTGMLLGNVDRKSRTVLVFGKGRKWRTVKYDAHTSAALARYLRTERPANRFSGEPQLWLAQRGPLKAQGLDALLRKAAGIAGVADVHPHLLRHTFADRWLSDGKSEGGLMAIAGWENRAMLDRYSRARASDRALEEYDQPARGRR